MIGINQSEELIVRVFHTAWNLNYKWNMFFNENIKFENVTYILWVTPIYFHEYFNPHRCYQTQTDLLSCVFYRHFSWYQVIMTYFQRFRLHKLNSNFMLWNFDAYPPIIAKVNMIGINHSEELIVTLFHTFSYFHIIEIHF